MAYCITVHGAVKRKKEIEQFAYDCLNHFFKGRIKRDIDIDIYIKRTLKGAWGYCSGDRDHAEIEIAKGTAKRLFPEEKLLKTIAHELVHAKQYIRGEIHPMKEYWKPLNGTKRNYPNASYWNQPWEREARKFESILYERYWEESE